MPTPFDRNRADFSRIDGTRNLYLAAVLHEAVVSVDEFGTEAGAGSAAVINNRMLRIPVSFRADRPFPFVITERSTGNRLSCHVRRRD